MPEAAVKARPPALFGVSSLVLVGNFIDVNETAHARLGYTEEELLALHISRRP